MSDASKEILGELLAQSLIAWGLDGTVQRASDASVLLSCNGTDIRVQAAPPDLPFRWMVTIDDRTRGAISLIAVASFAGTTYEFRNNTEDMLMGQNGALEGTAAVDGPNMKMTITRADNMAFKAGWIVLSRDGGKSRPVGVPSEDDCAIVESELASPGPGEVLVQIEWASCDPFQRGRMSEARSYAQPVAVGEVMTAQSAGEVVESNDERFAPGAKVVGQLGWQEYAVARGGTLRVVPDGIPLQWSLHVLGTPAEEQGIGKVFMVRDGLFDGVDAVLSWHPADTNEVHIQPSKACISFELTFHSPTAHASSALEARLSKILPVRAMPWQELAPELADYVQFNRRVTFILSFIFFLSAAILSFGPTHS